MKIFSTMLVDSLRLLRARALFWITLWISLFAALVYLSIGFTSEGISILFGLAEFKNDLLRQGSPYAETFYVGFFSKFIVGLWLSWVAIILALVSCSPIFPDFLTEGSVGLTLSKPVGRVRIFFYKYLGGLMFVAIQVALFCIVVFFAIRWRLGMWNFSIFWAIPLITLVFSYLYSVAVLVGVRTRSTMAAIMAAIGVWFGAWMIQKAEEVLYVQVHLPENFPVKMMEQPEAERWHGYSMGLLALFPKTTETTNLMDRLITLGGKRDFSQSEFAGSMFGMLMPSMSAERDEKADQAVNRHSIGFVIGTSLVFEAIVLAMACRTFCRRDY